MPDLFPLQEELFNILKKHAAGMFEKTCSLTNKKLYDAMKIKPNSEQYITRILQALKAKEKIEIFYEQTPEGLKRMIKVL